MGNLMILVSAGNVSEDFTLRKMMSFSAISCDF